jgi:hypothetical protein
MENSIVGKEIYNYLRRSRGTPPNIAEVSNAIAFPTWVGLHGFLNAGGAGVGKLVRTILSI